MPTQAERDTDAQGGAGRPRPGRPRPPLYLTLPAVLVGIAMLLPLAYLLIRSAEAGSDFFRLLARPRTFQVLVNTVLLSLSVAATSVLIAVPLAWLLIRTDLPGRRFWSVATALPLAVPSLVGGFTFVAAFGTGGIVHQWLSGWIDPARLPVVYGFPGAWALLSLLTYPYVLLPVRSTLHGLDPAQEEAARSLGHGSWAVFWHVVLPNLRPAILSGSLLVALYALSDFAAVSLLQFDSFTRAIYVQYQASFNRQYAAVLSLVLVGVTGGIVLLETAVRGRRAYFRTGTGSRRKTARVPLRHWRWPAFAACALLVILAVGLPIGVTLYWLLRGLARGEEIMLAWPALVNSLSVSLMAAGLTVAAALPIAFLSVRFRSPLSAALEKAAYLGYALPGIVVALSLVFFGARLGGPLYQSIWMLLFAYMVLFLPQALSAMRASLLQVSPNVENVARSLGYTPLRVLWHVTFPIIRPSIAAGGALVFLTVMKELPATLLLSPIGFRTLTTGIWAAISEAFYARAAAPALILVVASAVSLFFLLDDESSFQPVDNAD